MPIQSPVFIRRIFFSKCILIPEIKLTLFDNHINALKDNIRKWKSRKIEK